MERVSDRILLIQPWIYFLFLSSSNSIRIIIIIIFIFQVFIVNQRRGVFLYFTESKFQKMDEKHT